MHRWHSFVILSLGWRERASEREQKNNVGPIKNSIVFCYRHVFAFNFSPFFWFSFFRICSSIEPFAAFGAFFLSSFRPAAARKPIRYLCHACITHNSSLAHALARSLSPLRLFSFISCETNESVFARNDNRNRFFRTSFFISRFSFCP